jgi:hypothetical protein
MAMDHAAAAVPPASTPSPFAMSTATSGCPADAAADQARPGCCADMKHDAGTGCCQHGKAKGNQ